MFAAAHGHQDVVQKLLEYDVLLPHDIHEATSLVDDVGMKFKQTECAKLIWAAFQKRDAAKDDFMRGTNVPNSPNKQRPLTATRSEEYIEITAVATQSVSFFFNDCRSVGSIFGTFFFFKTKTLFIHV